MSKGKSTFRQNDVKRIIKVAQDAGLKVVAVEVSPDGKIRVFGQGGQITPTAPQTNPWDEV